MEDWSKYVFDPKNPKDFKAYKLLKKILKDGNAMLVTDMYYFNELFKKEIWTKDVVDELWDKPDNFSELSSNEKANVYRNNFSDYDFEEVLKKKLEKIKRLKNYQVFDLFFNKFSVLSSGNGKRKYIFNSSKFIQSLDSIKQAERTMKNFSSDEKNSFKLSSFHGLFFLEAELQNLSYSTFQLEVDRVSVFFIDEVRIGDYNFSQTHPYLHPIILKQDEDIHKLLDFIIRDIKNETRETPTHKPETYLEEIAIKNYFSLENIAMKNLGDKKEIYLMGENGDGKTILLQAIALALRGNKNVGSVIDIVKQNPHDKMDLTAITNDKEKYKYQINPKNQKKAFEPLLAYGIERFRNDSDQKDEVGYLSLFSKETYLENPEKWLQHLDYKETKGDLSEISLEQAKEILMDILERDVTINVTPNKVTFTEKGTTLQFNQLSDGYQSVIIWVCDMIARLSVLQPGASSTQDYSGIVIVDEIGAYLHPKWAYSIVKKLREWFPNIQFIFTTHNPIIILGASEGAAFYKVYKEKGKTKVSEPVEDISDLMLNSLVTSPLFNLPTARPKGFDDSNDLSSDDYIYRRIHQKIQEKLQSMPDLVDEDVIKMIEAELEKI